MNRKPTYAGTVEEKDAMGILFWAKEKSAFERLEEAWRLHCINHSIPFDVSSTKTIAKPENVMADIFNNDFLEYIDLLNKHNVEYLLVGGMAVNLHGYRRATGDMDIFVNPTKEIIKSLF